MEIYVKLCGNPSYLIARVALLTLPLFSLAKIVFNDRSLLYITEMIDAALLTRARARVILKSVRKVVERFRRCEQKGRI